MTTGPFRPEIETAPERIVVGTVRSYTMANRAEIPDQWHAFFDAGYTIPGALPDAMFGVSFDADNAGNFRYAVAREVPSEPADLTPDLSAITLAAGDYAVLRRFGPVARIPADFDRLFSEWLPASDFHIREGAVFERYPEDPRNGPDGMAYEIWIPVREKTKKGA